MLIGRKTVPEQRNGNKGVLGIKIGIGMGNEYKFIYDKINST